MPTYAYKCTNCDHRFEIQQRFSDDPLTECPKCHGKIRRVINSVGIVFKGSGFYVTDNRNGKANGAVSGSSRSEKDNQDKQEKKADNPPPTAKKSDSAGLSKSP